MQKKLLYFLAAWCMLAMCPTAANAQDDLTVIIEQNFDAFDQGSEQQPGTTDISAWGGKLRTTLTGWSGSKVYEAGGCLKIDGYVQTASSNMSSGGGNIRVSFRARALEGEGAAQVQMGYNTAQTVTFGDQWTACTVILTGGTATSFLKFTCYQTDGGILFDDLKVESSQSFVAAPIAVLPTDANGTSFTATWRAVTGATGYLLDVYSRDQAGDPVYVLQNQDVTTTTYKVNELTEGTQYYYRVRTVKGEYTSDYSNEVAVIKSVNSLDAPIVAEATQVSENGFDANWLAVDNATRYEVTLYKKEKATDAATINVLDEDFAKVTAGTLASPKTGSTLMTNLNRDTRQPGWHGKNISYVAGYLGLAPFGSSATLTTPPLDLHNNGGLMDVTINMASYYSTTIQQGDTLVVYVLDGDQCVDSAVVTLDGEFKDYHFTFNGGTAQTQLQLVWNSQKLATEYTAHKLYIDRLQINQNVDAGDRYTTFLMTKDAGDATTCHFDVPLSNTVKYDYQVVAFAPVVVSGYPNNEVSETASEASELMTVELNTMTSVTTPMTSVMSVRGGQGIVTINAPTGTAVTLYDVSGRIVAAGVCDGQVSMTAPGGVVIVRAGDIVRKVVVK